MTVASRPDTNCTDVERRQKSARQTVKSYKYLDVWVGGRSTVKPGHIVDSVAQVSTVACYLPTSSSSSISLLLLLLLWKSVLIKEILPQSLPAVEHLLSNSSATVVRWWFTGEAGDIEQNLRPCIRHRSSNYMESASTESQNSYLHWTVFPCSKDSSVHSWTATSTEQFSRALKTHLFTLEQLPPLSSFHVL